MSDKPTSATPNSFGYTSNQEWNYAQRQSRTRSKNTNLRMWRSWKSARPSSGVSAHSIQPSTLVSTVEHQDDAAGNLTSRSTTTYTYDWQDHLSQVTPNGAVTSFL